MTIKKPVKPAAKSAAPAAGGATIADRFKLDMPDPKAARKSGGAAVSSTAANIAFGAGMLAIALAGFLAFIIYQHWEFLKNA